MEQSRFVRLFFLLDHMTSDHSQREVVLVTVWPSSWNPVIWSLLVMKACVFNMLKRRGDTLRCVCVGGGGSICVCVCTVI